MRKVSVLLVIIIFFMTACGEKNTSINQTNNELKDAAVQPLGKDLENGNKMNPLFSEEIDVSIKGVEMPIYQQVSSQMIKGDDGQCYYFRKKNEKLIFYKNNGIKICETVFPDSNLEEKYIIDSFVKYNDKFFVHLFSYEESKTFLTAIQIATGEWCATIQYDYFDKIIIYENCFYCSIYGELTIIDLQGKKSKINIENEDSDVVIQMILGNKIFYTVFNLDGETAEVMCCDLDGENKRKLFQYRTIKGYSGYSDPGSLRVDEEYLYLLETDCEFVLTRIPLYGGIIEEIVETEWFELSNTHIFYADKNSIYRIDKKLKEAPQIVSKVYTPQYDIPFLYADNHLMIHGYNKTEHNMIDTIWESEIINSTLNDIAMNYSDEYYWMTEDGDIENTIQGSGFRDKWKELYNSMK